MAERLSDGTATQNRAFVETKAWKNGGKVQMNKPLYAVLALTSMGAAALAQGAPSQPAAASNKTLGTAIATIEKAMDGSKVLEIHAGDAGIYDAVVVSDGALSDIRLDVQNYKMDTLGKKETPAWMLGWEKRDDAKNIANAKIDLADATAVAEAETGGSATDAGLAKPLSAGSKALAYNVQILKDGKPVRVAVDATTNKMIADPSQFAAWTPDQPSK
jgi:uncharacterized membrane protein YkoI